MGARYHMALFSIYGTVYLALEIVARAFRGELVGMLGLSAPSLAGWTSLWMWPIGGVCGVLVANFHRHLRVPLWVIGVIGVAAIMAVELAAGLLLNVGLGLALWSYAGWPLNLAGQVCGLYAPIWFLLIPMIVWLDLAVQAVYWDVGAPPTLWYTYSRMFAGR